MKREKQRVQARKAQRRLMRWLSTQPVVGPLAAVRRRKGQPKGGRR